MAAQVDFYILDSSDEPSRMRTVCRVADKVQRMGHEIFVLTADSNQSKLLDDLMWTFSQSSFLPHAMVNDSDVYRDQHPVRIHHELAEDLPLVLINLKEQQASVPDSVERIVEIVNQDEQIKYNGRKKYVGYKNQSLTIKTHNISV